MLVRAKADDKENILLLGMVFSNEQYLNRGQEFRDRFCCEALENLGFNVFTVDDKHDDTKSTVKPTLTATIEWLNKCKNGAA